MSKAAHQDMGHSLRRKIQRRSRIRKMDRRALRERLMRQIQVELDRGGMMIRSRRTAPLVFDLADVAKASRSRRITFRGVVFKLRPGAMWLTITDEFGIPLFSTDRGLL